MHKPLRRRRIGIAAELRHRDGAIDIAELLADAEFVRDRRIRRDGADDVGGEREAAALQHKSRNQPVAELIHVAPALHILQEVLHRDRRVLVIKLRFDVTEHRSELDERAGADR